MKLRIFFAVLLVAGAWVAGRALASRGGVSGAVESASAEVRAGQRVINDSYKLAPGARVEVSGINGPVTVATTDGDTAEIHVVSDAADTRDLEKYRIVVEQAGDRLVVRGEGRKKHSVLGWLLGRRSGGSVEHRVELKVPRRVDLRASGINGKLTVGALEGAVKISGVNGPVDVARAGGRAEVSGVNGPVTVGLASLAGDGVKVSGINGPVELRLAPDVNADVSVSGLHGSVSVDDPRVTIDEQEHSNFEGRVGAGGTPIRVSGIHGNVTLARG